MLCRSPLQTMLANLQIRYHYLQALHEHCKITKGWLRIRLWLITSKCYSFLIRTKLWQSPNPLCKQQQSTKWAAGIQLHFDHTQSTLCLHWCLLASYCASHSSSHLQVSLTVSDSLLQHQCPHGHVVQVLKAFDLLQTWCQQLVFASLDLDSYLPKVSIYHC